MRRMFLALSAVALLLVTADVASARPRWGVNVGYGGGGYGWGGPGYSVSYGTRVGDGFLNVGYSSGYSYPAYGYAYPAYGYAYPSYGYAAPVYYAAPAYYSYPSYGYSYGRRGWGW